MPDWRPKPRRPALTPVFLFGLTLWGACALGYTICAEMGASTCIALTLVSGSLAIFALACSFMSSKKTVLMLVAATLMGLSLAGSDASRIHATAESIDTPHVGTVHLTLLEDCSDNGFLPRALCVARLEDGRTLLVQASFSGEQLLLCGMTCCAFGTLSCMKAKEAPYGWQKGTLVSFDAKRISLDGNIEQQLSLSSFRLRAIKALEGDDAQHALLQALVCGYRESMHNSQEYGSFQTAGLAHLVAVSGAHLVIVVGMASVVLSSLRLPRRACACVLVALMASYTIVAGMPISCIRAALMSSVGVLSLFGKRRPSSLNALGISIVAIITSAPHASVSVSFALSALSTMGIVLFVPLADLALQDRINPKTVACAHPLVITSCAAALSQLYACSIFSQLPLISPLANLICAPLFPVCCLFGLLSALSGAVGFAFSDALIEIACVPCQILVLLVDMLSRVPFACVPFSIDSIEALIASFSLAAFLWVLWERCLTYTFAFSAGAFAIAVALGFSLVPQPDGIALLDVGQGDAFLIRSRGVTLLVDTGNHDRLLLDQLARCGILHLDGVLVTHADDDHCGSLDALEKTVDVGTVYLHEGMLESTDDRCKQLVSQSHACARAVTGLHFDDTLAVGLFNLRIVWPHSFSEEGGNADSIVALAEYHDQDDETPALFTGDAESEELAQIIEESDVGTIDVLKVGHHGSKNAFTREQLHKLRPSVALIGVGKDNRYGHPASEIIRMLDESDCSVFRSDEDGGVFLEMNAIAFRIHRL